MKSYYKYISERLEKVQLNAAIRILAICLIAGIGVCGYYGYRYFWPTPYIATQGGFKIVFPQLPKVSNIAAKSDGTGGTESGIVYNAADQSTNADYAVYVFSDTNSNSSLLSKSDTIADLQTNIEQLATSSDAKLSNGQTITFNGLTAVEATLTPNAQGTSPTDVIAFLKKTDLYMIMGSGLSQHKYDAFAHTFRFIE